MKFVGLAVMLICLNFMVGIVNTLDIGLISAGSNTLDGKIDEADLDDTMDSTGLIEIASTADWDPLTYVIKAFDLLMRFAYQVTLGLPDMLRSTPFNLPDAWVNLFIVVEVFIYAAGIAEIARGTAVEY